MTKKVRLDQLLVQRGLAETRSKAQALIMAGAVRVAERFAIDFVQLNDENRLNAGPIDQLSSYAYFGDEIHAVADGTVVEFATAAGLLRSDSSAGRITSVATPDASLAADVRPRSITILRAAELLPTFGPWIGANTRYRRGPEG